MSMMCRIACDRRGSLFVAHPPGNTGLVDARPKNRASKRRKNLIRVPSTLLHPSLFHCKGGFEICVSQRADLRISAARDDRIIMNIKQDRPLRPEGRPAKNPETPVSQLGLIPVIPA